MENKKYIPSGMTETEVIDIIYKVCRAVAPKYRFGFNGNDDMIQQGVLLSIKFLTEGKFKPRGDKPLSKQLTNFLYVWVNNRLNNYRRDNSSRYPHIDREPNRSKYNLMHCLLVYSQELTHSDIFADDTDIPDIVHRREAISKMLDHLTPAESATYYKLINEEKVSFESQLQLFERIRSILGEEFVP